METTTSEIFTVLAQLERWVAGIEKEQDKRFSVIYFHKQCNRVGHSWQDPSLIHALYDVPPEEIFIVNIVKPYSQFCSSYHESVGITVKDLKDLPVASELAHLFLLTNQTEMFFRGRFYVLSNRLLYSIPYQSQICSRIGFKTLLKESKFKALEKGVLNRLGIPLDSKVVIFHVRDQEWTGVEGRYHDYRNASIQNYKLAAQFLIKRGYFVVRIGDQKMSRFEPDSCNFIDLPHNKNATDGDDIVLISCCDFYVGQSSGPYSVALLLNKDIVLTNEVLAICGRPFPVRGQTGNSEGLHLSLLKHKVDRKSGHEFDVLEDISRSNLSHLRSEGYENHGIMLKENTPEEILEAVEEMIELKSCVKFPPEALALQELAQLGWVARGFSDQKLINLGRPSNRGFLSRVYAPLLKKYPFLLSERTLDSMGIKKLPTNSEKTKVLKPKLSPKSEMTQLVKAQKLQQAKRHDECLQLCRSIIKKNPNNAVAFEILGLTALDKQDFNLAQMAAEKLMELEPLNANGGLIGSIALMSKGLNDQAINVLENQLVRTPSVSALLFNLHSALANTGNNTKAIDVALKCVALEPTNSDAFNNLGSSLFAVGRHVDADIAFDTAIQLNPENFTARLNRAHGMADDQMKVDEINKVLEKYKNKIQERVLISSLHNTAFAYLRLGQLTEGWKRLEHGLSPLILDSTKGRRPQRNFNRPRWNGQPLNGRRLLVWREQGLGDEIMFGSVLPELKNSGGKIILECEPRLVTLLQRSFPDFKVRPELYRASFPFDSPNDDFDFQIPLGSLCGIFRQQISDFSRSSSYLVPAEELHAKFYSRIAELTGGAGVNVGICWRSGVVSPTRGPSYTSLDDWKPLFEIPGINVFNLQYGPFENEITEFESRHRVRLFRWADLDLQGDLEGTSALIKNMDIVISVGTSVAQLSGAVGVRTFLCANQYNWTSFSTKDFLFFPDITLVIHPNHDTTDSVLLAIDSLKESLTSNS